MSRRRTEGPIVMPSSHLVIVYFCRHLQHALAGEFPRFLSESDILVIEFNMKDERIDEYEKDFNRLAEGDLTPDSMMNKYPQGDASLIRLLCRCRKRVVLERSPVTETEFKEYLRLDREASVMKQNLDLVRAVDLKLKALRKFAEMNTRRDKALADMTRELVSQAPGEKILICRGVAHQRSLISELRSRSISCESVSAEAEKLDKESELIEKLANGESTSPAEILGVIS